MYKIFFVGILVAPVLIAADISIWMILIYLMIVTFVSAINPKVPPMIALGLFGEFIEADPSILGGIIVFYFILSGVERQFCQGFQLKESIEAALRK